MPIHNLVISCGYAESQSFAQVVANYIPGAKTKEEIIEKFIDIVKRFLVHQKLSDIKECCIKLAETKTGIYCSKCGTYVPEKEDLEPDEDEINEFVRSLHTHDIDSFGGEDDDFFSEEGWCFWQGITGGHVVQVDSWDYPTAKRIDEYWVGPIPASELTPVVVTLETTDQCKDFLIKQYPDFEPSTVWKRLVKDTINGDVRRIFAHKDQSGRNVYVTLITNKETHEYISHDLSDGTYSK